MMSLIETWMKSFYPLRLVQLSSNPDVSASITSIISREKMSTHSNYFPWIGFVGGHLKVV